MLRTIRFNAGRDWSSWPVLLLLLTVLVPSAGVVWMMRAAMESERLAVRQRLADLYRVQLETAKHSIADEWEKQLESLEAAAGELPAAEAFAACVATGACDSVVVLDAAGDVAYPNVVTASAAPVDDLQWQNAERMEFAEGDLAGAAAAYGRIAEATGDETLAARSEQAQARCLMQLGRRTEAVEVLHRIRPRTTALDSLGRSLSADAELRLLEVLDRQSVEWVEVRASLRRRLQRYGDPSLTSDQRRFLMRRMEQLASEKATFPMLDAEDLAADLLVSEGVFARDGAFWPTAVKDVWSVALPNGRVVALYRTATLESRLKSILAKQLLPAGLAIEVRQPGQSAGVDDELSAGDLGPPLAGWRLALRSTSGEFFNEAATARQAALAWVAGVLLAVTLGMTWLVASAVRRQMSVARLKNDLVATVSHELKTPLASIRLLVDTLLEGDGATGGAAGVNGKGREYLQMISQENSRLTRLIDNFLTFSRMERGKQQFAFESVDAREIVAQAVAAVSDRFDGLENRLVADVPQQAGESDLWVRGDMDALVTAVVNLLDNAWKYGGEQKQVRVSARRAGDRVLIAVEDSGAGLTPRAARRVFERFYQVDQRLSRTQGGCGLGLSIVRDIVEAHGGEATVESRPGEGCRFTISLPAEGAAGSNEGSDWSLKRPVQTSAGSVGGERGV